jgi:alkaline phosphatase D
MPPMTGLRGRGQFKRVHQYAIRELVHGRLDSAEKFLKNRLKEHPDEPESLFCLGLLQAQRTELDQARSTLQRAIDQGLPPGRVFAGPRLLTRPLAGTEWYQKLLEKHRHEPVHGPMLGHVSDTSARVWCRVARADPVRVRYRPAASDQSPSSAEPAQAKADQDYTVKLKLTDLKPATRYEYDVVVGDADPAFDPPESQTFQTQGEGEKPRQFTIAFGGCSGSVPQHEYVWETINSFDPRAFITLGDNVYIDDPLNIHMQRYSYYRRQSRPAFRQLTAGRPVYAIWDDHDFSTNDSRGGPKGKTPYWKRWVVWPTFQQNWINPGHGGGNDRPGCYYTYKIGDVQFIMLDCRYYRQDPSENKPSMLGARQKAWLKQTLRESEAKFKVLASSVPWDWRTKGNSNDTWNGYRAERTEIFKFLRDQKIEGVVLISADRHRSDAWGITQDAGKPEGLYDLYEFQSGRFTNQHVHEEKAKALFSYNDKQSFGLIRFDTREGQASVTYEVRNIDGKKVHTLELSHDQLSWQSQ